MGQRGTARQMMEDDPDGPGQDAPVSLMPYDTWTEQAMRHVAVQALKHVAQNGLPGEHHFYLTFRTDDPGTVIPPRLKTQYPQEMTIVLQHQFWDLVIDDGGPGPGQVRIGLSFGGVPSTLVIPIDAITAFADPHIGFGVRFRYVPPEPEAAAEPADAPDSGDAPETPPTTEAPQVVSLDAFRRRTPPRDS
jgi:uncharacterized protein